MLRYETGDAAGQNMTTVVSWQVAKWAKETAEKELGIHIEGFQVDGKRYTRYSLFNTKSEFQTYVLFYSKPDVRQETVHFERSVGTRNIGDG